MDVVSVFILRNYLLWLVVLCNVLPYVEEFARAVRYRMKAPVKAKRPRL